MNACAFIPTFVNRLRSKVVKILIVGCGMLIEMKINFSFTGSTGKTNQLNA